MRMERLRGGDAQARLARALVTDALAAGCTLTVEAVNARPWASATYVGEQQAVSVHVEPADAARRWLAMLPDANLPMRGHVAMPPAVDRMIEEGDSIRADLSVLTLNDG